MTIYTIRARHAGDAIIGEVLDGERVVATCMNGYTCDEEALAAATEKRDRLEADWQKYMERIRNRKPSWNGIDWICTCGAEVIGGSCDNGHLWKQTDEGWVRA